MSTTLLVLRKKFVDLFIPLNQTKVVFLILIVFEYLFCVSLSAPTVYIFFLWMLCD